jgi:hypothetical protein
MFHKRCASLITSDRPPPPMRVVHSTVHTCGRPHKLLTPGSRRVSGSRRPAGRRRGPPALDPVPQGVRRPKRSTSRRYRPGSSTGMGSGSWGRVWMTGARRPVAGWRIHGRGLYRCPRTDAGA